MPDTDVVTNVLDRTLTIRRMLNAPPSLVFRAWTEPERFARWAGCDGHTIPLATIRLDVRPGGEFSWVMVSDLDGSAVRTTGTYLDVVEPSRLVLRWHDVLESVATITFTDLGDGRTEMLFQQVGFTSRALESGLRDSRAGHAEEIDRLVTYLADL